MVWYEYVLEALHGDGLETPPSSPGTPKSPTIDPRKFINDEDSIDLYFYLKQLVYESYYDGMILDERDFNSYSLFELINTRRFSEKIENFEHYRGWVRAYRQHVQMLHEYMNRSLRVMGTTIAIPYKLFERFVYYHSGGYITQY